jgi:hypothetical protein
MKSSLKFLHVQRNIKNISSKHRQVIGLSNEMCRKGLNVVVYRIAHS